MFKTTKRPDEGQYTAFDPKQGSYGRAGGEYVLTGEENFSGSQPSTLKTKSNRRGTSPNKEGNEKVR